MRDYWQRHRNDQAFRQKEKARAAVKRAIEGGRLVREACSACGRPPGKPAGRQVIQAHHPRGYDEDRILDIEWLCTACHGKAHAGKDRPVRLTIEPKNQRRLRFAAALLDVGLSKYLNDLLDERLPAVPETPEPKKKVRDVHDEAKTGAADA